MSSLAVCNGLCIDEEIGTKQDFEQRLMVLSDLTEDTAIKCVTDIANFFDKERDRVNGIGKTVHVLVNDYDEKKIDNFKDVVSKKCEERRVNVDFSMFKCEKKDEIDTVHDYSYLVILFFVDKHIKKADESQKTLLMQ
jgi:hypothetical protein